MLTLKDLSADKELDRKALTEVRGGFINNVALQDAYSTGVGGLVGISDVDQHQLVSNYYSDFDYKEALAFNIGTHGSIAAA